MAIVNFVWDPLSDNVLKETDDTDATVTNYTHAPNRFGEALSQHQQVAGDTYFHYDGLGCTRNLTAPNETVVRTNTYTGFGDTVSSNGLQSTVFGWNGAVGYYTDDETGVFYVRRRTYNPDSGRWRSRDPLGFVDGPNVYAYVTNLVPNNVDPSGLVKFCQAIEMPPKAETECGGIKAKLKYFLAPSEGETVLHVKQYDGYIIQHVTWSADITDCLGEPVDPIPTDIPPPYFETWQVVQGITQGFDGTDYPLDQWTNPDQGYDTKGNMSISATVEFIRNYDYQGEEPPWLGYGIPGHIEDAGIQPTLTPGPPTGWEGGVLPKTLKWKWVCCPCREITPTEIVVATGFEDKCVEI